MFYLSLFLAGFTLGVFAALKIFAPERREELWDPQHFPVAGKTSNFSHKPAAVQMKKPLATLPRKQQLPQVVI